MATISATLNLGTISPAITSVKLLSCLDSSCSGGTVITGFDNVLVSSFPRIVSGIPDTANYIKVEALGTCVGTSQCILISGLPGTPTPTPTATSTPTPTPTLTPTPTATTTSQTMVWNLSRCSDGQDATQVLNYDSNSNLDPGVVIKGSNGICYTIEVTGYSSQPPITVMTEISGDCSNCTDGGPTPLSFTVTTGCTNYQGTLSVNLEGGTGTGYYWSIISGPAGYPTGNQSDNATVTGLSNGNYAILVGDSDGNNQSTNEIYNVTCASAPNNTASANLVIQSLKPTSAQCASGTPYTFDLGSPAATFCTATRYTALGLTTLGTGNSFWLCYEGQTRQVFHPSNAGYFDTAGSCQTL